MSTLEEKYKQLVSNAVYEAKSANNETIYKIEYNFRDPTLKDHKEYVVTSGYVDAYLVEQKIMEALHEIDKAREIDYAVMQAKIEAYELALGKFPEPKTTKEENKKTTKKKE